MCSTKGLATLGYIISDESDFNNGFSHVFPLQHSNESFGCILKTLRNVLSIFQFALHYKSIMSFVLN